MKILITGGAGYIGATVCAALADAGHTPIILDSLATGHKPFTKGHVFCKGDIANAKRLKKIKQDHPDITTCIHFAARAIVQESVENPTLYYTENVAKSIALFSELHQLGFKNVIFSSSAAVYGETASTMVTEETPAAPLNPYANTKLATEMVLKDCCEAGYFRGTALRYFNPIGADPKMRTGPFKVNPSHLLGRLMDVAAGKTPEFQLFGDDWPTPDGYAIRDFIHVWDLAQAHVRVAENAEKLHRYKPYETLNLGTGKGTSVMDFVKAFESISGKKIPIKQTKRRPGDTAGAFACCGKAEVLLGWKAERTVEEAIRHALIWEEVRKT